MTDTDINKNNKAHGLTEKEYNNILKILNGRKPNNLELGIFDVMWSEHCSYKSSKKWLKTLPTKAPWVICGPGENAGVIDVGDNLAVIFKMESHNHPSFIEPYQGAATGVGGILRDVFTMGARPIANMNALRFGDINHKKTKHLLSGVISGIGGYGNCVGVPTVGGEVNFHKSYNGNILVNAMTVGLADKNKIFYSAASGVGNPVIYVGSKTGKDGIHGATMASAEFDDNTEEKRPTVQVGDPFTEKLLIEACLELMATDSIIAIQDMGAAGLTCSTFEMCSKGGTGIELNLDNVPVREKDMSAYDIMLSESQERMLMVVKPEKEELARSIFKKWELDFSVIGYLTDTKKMVLLKNGKEVANLPIDPLAEESPEYDRPWVFKPQEQEIKKYNFDSIHWTKALKILNTCPDLVSREWIWTQYDHMVMGDTIQRPGGDAAVVRIHNSNKAIAITTDTTPRYVSANAYEGGKQAVAESFRNLCSVGSTPLAITDNLNFGNPEKPNIMGQLVKSIEGIGIACKELEMPVVSGNVSLYNETDGEAIQPTPTIGAVGLIESIDNMITMGFKNPDDPVFLIGGNNNFNKGWLGQSLFAREVFEREEGAPPNVNLQLEKLNGNFIKRIINKKLINSCHDISDGGIAICLLEMGMASSIGFTLEIDSNVTNAWLFGEDQGRYIITCKNAMSSTIIDLAKKNKVSIFKIGSTGGKYISFSRNEKIYLDELKNDNKDWLTNYMSNN